MNGFLGILVTTWLIMAPNQGEPGESPEIGRIPHYTWAAAHIKLGSIVSSPLLKSVKDSIDNAGPEAMKILNNRFAIHPFNIDRITIVHLDPPRPTSNEPFFKYFGIMIATKANIDPKHLAMNLGVNNPDFLQSESYNFTYWISGREAIAIPEPKLLIIGEKNIVKDLVKAKNGLSPESFRGLIKDDISIIVNQKTPPVNISQLVPSQFLAITKAKSLNVHINLTTKPSMLAQLSFVNNLDTEQAETALRNLAKNLLTFFPKIREEMQRKLEGSYTTRPSRLEDMPDALMGFFSLAGIKEVEDIIAKPALRVGNTLTVAKFDLQLGPQPGALVGPLISLFDLSTMKAREQSEEQTQKYINKNNLKIIGLATLNYESSYKKFPSNIIDKKTGEPLLSWRVAILPYIEQESLYREFKLDEPWNSPNNLKLAKKMPRIYKTVKKPLSDGDKPDETIGFKTNYLGIQSNDGIFEQKKNIKVEDIKDGLSNTIMIVEAKKDAIWTKPEDLEPLAANPATPNILIWQFPDGFHALFADGSVRFFPQNTPIDLLLTLFTKSGGETIDQLKLP